MEPTVTLPRSRGGVTSRLPEERHVFKEPPPTVSQRTATASGPVLIFPGDGIFFWWQAGAVEGLRKRFDLSRIPVAGSSAGALSAVGIACELDMHRAMDGAFRLSAEAGVWDRGKFGLFGLWGGTLRTWLDELLPDDAHNLCNDRVHVAMKSVPHLSQPYFRTQLVGNFRSREDLISATMASVHIPYFMDHHATARFRGRRYVDGSLSLTGRPAARHLYLPGAASHVRLSSALDPRIAQKYKHPSDIVTATPAGVQEMFEWGEQYVATLDEAGGLSALEELRLRR